MSSLSDWQEVLNSHSPITIFHKPWRVLFAFLEGIVPIKGVGVKLNGSYRGRNWVPSKNYRGKIGSTEAEFRYPRKITEVEFWLMLHPETEI